ncbi:MAG: hypothetical protein LBI54_06170 [Lachnospiraceae bacterium]|nr:hypothetical protein [Lachnospiraceae bacterium]
MAKHFITGAMLLISLFLLTACSAKNLTETEIEANFNETVETMLSPSETLDTFEIINREIDKEVQKDTVWCRVETHDDEAAYVRFYELSYQLVDKAWALNSTKPYRESDWTKAPTVGASDSMVNSSLTKNTLESYLGSMIRIDGDEWYLQETELGNTEIVGRDTQLAQKTDKVTVSVEILHDVLMAQGEMQLDFKYDDRWILDNASVTSHFVSSHRPGTEHEFNESEAISAIAKWATDNPIEFADSSLSRQTPLSVSADEVSDLTMLGSAASNTATTLTYVGSFALNKKTVSFDVNTTIIYQYDRAGGWSLREIALSPAKINTVKTEEILGEWSGSYKNHLAAIDGTYAFMLEITDIGSDGAVTATFHDTSANPYSVEMTGYFSLTDLSVSIKSEGSHPLISKTSWSWRRDLDSALSGYLIVESNTMKSYYDTGIKDETYYFDFEITKN